MKSLDKTALHFVKKILLIILLGKLFDFIEEQNDKID